MLKSLKDATFGPAPYALPDWRRRIDDLYAEIRAMDDPKAAWEHWRTTRSAMFRDHPMSPLPKAARQTFTEIDVFPYDPTFRFAVDLAPETGDLIPFDLGRDGVMMCKPVARTLGLERPLGAELTLYWIEGYGGGLFLPFLDGTSGNDTYGGGRYAIDAIKGSDLGLDTEGCLILDFNFAYNPSCSLSDDYVCPLAPRDNRVPAKITAGERRY